MFAILLKSFKVLREKKLNNLMTTSLKGGERFLFIHHGDKVTD